MLTALLVASTCATVSGLLFVFVVAVLAHHKFLWWAITAVGGAFMLTMVAVFVGLGVFARKAIGRTTGLLKRRTDLPQTSRNCIVCGAPAPFNLATSLRGYCCPEHKLCKCFKRHVENGQSNLA